MIQTLTRVFFFINLWIAALFMWLVWHCKASLVWALLAALIGFVILPKLLILQGFITSMRANKGLAGMSFMQWLKAFVTELSLSIRVFNWRQPWRVKADSDYLDKAMSKRGVLLVHGFLCNRALWHDEMQRLRSKGVPHMAITLEPAFGSISEYAEAMKNAVETLYTATGMAPVIVGHSMGGLAIRAYVVAHGHERVAQLITLGTPHHGTKQASSGHGQNANEMRLNSAWQQTNAAALSPEARAKFICFYSNGDNIVSPFESAMLEGADNRRIEATGHLVLAFTSTFRECLDQVLAT